MTRSTSFSSKVNWCGSRADGFTERRNTPLLIATWSRIDCTSRRTVRKLLFVTRYSMASRRTTPFSRERNCSAAKDNFSRSFGRIVSSFPTLLSQRIGRSERPKRSRTFCGNSRVMTRPFFPAFCAIRKRRYASSGVASRTRYEEESFRRGGGASPAEALDAVAVRSTCGAPHDGHSEEPMGMSSPHATQGARDGVPGVVWTNNAKPHTGHASAPGGIAELHRGHDMASLVSASPHRGQRRIPDGTEAWQMRQRASLFSGEARNSKI